MKSNCQDALTSPSIPDRSLPSYFFMGAPAIRSTHRIRPWSSMLLGEGYASWTGDSFTPRGGYSRNGVPSSAGALDVLATPDFLAKRPDVQRNNIAVMGFSHCGSIVLDAVAMAADRQVNGREVH
jgi:dienelactone hydrolase